MICGSCTNGEHHLARHDLHVCECRHPRCVSDEPQADESDLDREARESVGAYDPEPTEDDGFDLFAEAELIPWCARVVRA